MNKGVMMISETGDDDKDELTSEWGSESRVETWLARLMEWIRELRVETWLARLMEWTREKWVESRDMTGEADGMNQGVDSKDLKTGWRVSEWVICDFQWGDGWWARKGDNRCAVGTAEGLNRDQIVKIARLTGCKNFVGKRETEVYIQCVRWM